MIQGVLLQEQELWHALHTLCLSNGTCHQRDIRARGDSMCPFDIKGGFGGPADHCSIIWIEGLGTERGIDLERWRIRKAECLIKRMQITLNGGTAERVNDNDSLTCTIVTLIEQAIDVIRSAYLKGIVTGNAELLATLLVCRRRLRSALYKAI